MQISGMYKDNSDSLVYTCTMIARRALKNHNSRKYYSMIFRINFFKISIDFFLQNLFLYLSFGVKL